MTKKEIEIFFAQRFLEYYYSPTGKQYEIDTRPEDSKIIPGTYDFLCKEKNSKNDYLALEEKELNKSKENVRDNEVVRRLVNRVTRKIKEKGLPINGEYCFYLDFESAPKKNEEDTYVQKIDETVEQAIHEARDTDICSRIDFKLEGFNRINRFSLLNKHKSKTGKVLFPFHCVSNFSEGISSDTLNALSKILVNADSQLKIPKEMEYKTILLIIKYLVLGDEHTIRAAMQFIPLELHVNVDEIFLVSKKGFDDDYDFHQIK